MPSLSPVSSLADIARAMQHHDEDHAPIFRRPTNQENAKARENERRRKQGRVGEAKALLRMLLHASTCTKPAGRCPMIGCEDYRLLWQHARGCDEAECGVHPRCVEARRLLRHHSGCRNRACPVCEPAHTLQLLDHASVCRRRNCATPHCADYRRLWKHARDCRSRDQNREWCEKHPLCVGARRLHDHFALCQRAGCVMCEPLVQDRRDEARQAGGSLSPMHASDASDEDC